MNNSKLTVSEIKKIIKLANKNGLSTDDVISTYCCKHCKFHSYDCEENVCEFEDFDKCVDYFFDKKFGEININDFL